MEQVLDELRQIRESRFGASLTRSNRKGLGIFQIDQGAHPEATKVKVQFRACCGPAQESAAVAQGTPARQRSTNQSSAKKPNTQQNLVEEFDLTS
jgi:hypothetical protein